MGSYDISKCGLKQGLDEPSFVDGFGRQFVIPSQFNKNEVFASLQKRLQHGQNQLAQLKLSSESQCQQLNAQLEALQMAAAPESAREAGEHKMSDSPIIPEIHEALNHELQPYWSAVLSNLRSEMTIDADHL